MTVYVVTTNYIEGTYHFGVYSSLLNARKAILDFFQNFGPIKKFKDNHDYTYTITDYKGQDYWVEIETDTIDADC